MAINVLDPRPIQILTLTRDLITDQRRWFQGGWAGLRRNGWRFVIARCLLQALDTAEHRLWASQEDSNAAEAAIVLAIMARGWETIPEFNDSTRTRHHHVLRVIEEAIDRIRDPEKYRPRRALGYTYVVVASADRDYAVDAAA